MTRLLAGAIRLLLALALLTPLVVTADPWPSTIFPFVVGKALWSRTLIEVALGLWVILLLAAPAYRPPKAWLLALLGLYAAAALLAALLGVGVTRSLWSTFERMDGWVGLAHWSVFALLLAAMFRTWAQWRRLLNASVLVGLAAALIALAQHYGGWFGYLHIAGGRLTGTFGNPSYAGGFAAVNACIAAGLLFSSFGGGRWVSLAALPPPAAPDGLPVRSGLWGLLASRRLRLNGWRLLLAAALLLDLAALWLTGTRGALMGLFAGALAAGAGYALWGRAFRLRLAALGLLLAAAGLAAALSISIARAPDAARPDAAPPDLSLSWEELTAAEQEPELSGMAERFLSPDIGSTFKSRLPALRIGWEGFLEQPVHGWGPEQFAVIYDGRVSPEIISEKPHSFDRAHNRLIGELASAGLVGFLPYLALWLYAAWVVARKLPARPSGVSGKPGGKAGGEYVAEPGGESDGDTGGETGNEPGGASGGELDGTTVAELDSDTGNEPGPEQGRQALILLAGAGLAAYFIQNLFLFDTAATAPQLFMLLGFAAFIETWRPGRASRETGGRHPFKANPATAAAAETPDSPPPPPARRRPSPAQAAWWLAALVGGLAAAALMLTAVYTLNYRVYAASGYALDALNDARPWPQRFAAFEQAAAAFPPLSNELFILMLGEVQIQFASLDEDGFAAALQLAERHGAAAAASEPQNWRLYLVMADLHQLAAEGDGAYLPRSRQLLDRAAELAPWKIEVRQRLAVQEALEGRPQAGLQLVDDYLARAPGAARHFLYLRERLLEYRDIQEERRRWEEERQPENGRPPPEDAVPPETPPSPAAPPGE